VTVPGRADWKALVEVRGYGRSLGKTENPIRLQRFALHWAGKHGRTPAGLRYVVNAALDDDPSRRGPALQGADGDVTVFAGGGGLVIGTRDPVPVPARPRCRASSRACLPGRRARALGLARQ